MCVQGGAGPVGAPGDKGPKGDEGRKGKPGSIGPGGPVVSFLVLSSLLFCCSSQSERSHLLIFLLVL